MKYVLSERYLLRGWKRSPCGIYDSAAHEPRFFPREAYSLILRCDGAHDLIPDSLSEKETELLHFLEKENIIHPAKFGEFLQPQQSYKAFPAQYKHEAHWSVTGACNLRCRHCFMSAPSAKHGNPSYEELISVADQLAECGIFQVSLTGGEPLIRKDFPDLVKALKERGIGVDVIFTNGLLLTEDLLDRLEAIDGGRKIPFQLSFDGIGAHDFLRGIPGTEEKTLAALRLLQRRGYRVNVAMCLHKKNMDTVRETVKLMADLGVAGMKVGSMISLGEWASPDLRDLELGFEERMAFFEKYIPEYFEDGAPLPITLSGTFSYAPGEKRWRTFFVKETPADIRDSLPSCGAMKKAVYIGADGMVAPCMGMGDCEYAKHFPNLSVTPLREILDDPEFLRLGSATIGDVQNGNDKCRSCEYKAYCAGGCRNSALAVSDNYYDADPEACWFFHNGGMERVRAAAENAFNKYLEKVSMKSDGTESV